MEQPGLVASVNVGRVAHRDGALARGTAIDKRPQDGQVALGPLGLSGDAVGNTKLHGGRDQAVYAYAIEDLRHWGAVLAGELPHGLAPGMFGENLTTLGIDVTNAVIGERWQIGSAILQVTSPRTPCRTFADWLGVADWMTRFTSYGAPGAYLRVERTGAIGRGDTIEVLTRPSHGVTVDEVFRAVTGDRSLALRMLQAPELATRLHVKARKWVGLDDPDPAPSV